MLSVVEEESTIFKRFKIIDLPLGSKRDAFIWMHQSEIKEEI